MDQERKERERLKRLSKLAASTNNRPAKVVEGRVSTPEAAKPAEIRREPVAEAPTKPIQETASQDSQQPTESLEQWTTNTIATTLEFTLDPEAETHCSYYLAAFHEELSTEMSDEVDSPRLGIDNIDRALLSRLNTESDGEAPFDYLLRAYNTADSLARQLKRGSYLDEKHALLAEIKRLSVSYAGLSIAMPEILEETHVSPNLLARFLHTDQEAQGIPPAFLKELVEKSAEEGWLDSFFGPLLINLSQTLTMVMLTDNFYRHFAVLRTLLSYKDIAVAFVNMPQFNPSCSAPEIEFQSLLGPYFRISPISGKVSEQTFGLDASPTNISSGISSLRTTIPVIQGQLFDISNILIRASVETRNALLSYFATIINMNKKRHAIQVDAATVSSDGFMLNLTAVLNQFADPFVSDVTKLSKIDVEYLRRSPLINLDDETRLAADENSTKEYYSHIAPGENNFISHIFFLNVAAHHYGLGATMSVHQKLLEKIRDMQKYKDRMQSEQPFTGPQAMMMTQQYQRIEKALAQSKSISYCYEAVLCDEATQARSFSFLNLVATWLVRCVDEKQAYPQTMISLPLRSLESAEAYRNLPEYFVEDIAEYFLYVSRMMPRLLTNAEVTSLVIFSLVFLRSSSYIKNPYLKAKLVEILYNGIRPLRQGDSQGALGSILNSHRFALQHLFPALMGFYIEVESTGLSSQFYDKFNIRYHISQIFKSIWDNPAHREKLELESKNDIDFFVRFIALLLNDQTYLLDEALAKLSEIHGLQIELRDTEDKTTQEYQERQGHLAQSERSATSYLQLGTETLSMLNLFTASIPDAFCTPEIIDRLATMLDYNVEALVGPKCTGLKVQNPEKYHFDPKALLSGIVGIFLNMAGHNAFVVAVAKDGRSYKKERFDRTCDILRRHSLRSSTDIEQLELFVTHVEARKVEYEQDEEDLGDVPEEFLDPLMGDIMTDPVMLPTSKNVLDRSTIKRHLLNDATDPFNRAPLQLSDVVPADDLRSQIEAFRASKKRA